MPLWLDPPRPSTGAPPAVADSSSKGAMPGYALEDHTHASKARKDRKTVTTGQPFTWVYPTPFAAGVEPLPFGQARVPTASTDIYNVQTIGTPSRCRRDRPGRCSRNPGDSRSSGAGALMDLQKQIAALLNGASAADLKRLDALIEPELKKRWRPNPGPQTQAYYSEADILFYGGQAGGGKSELLLGLALEEHTASVIYRREFVDLVGEAGLLRRLTQILGAKTGVRESPVPGYRGNGRVIEFGALDKPKAEDNAQGRRRDFLGFDEGAQLPVSKIRFIMGWLGTAKKGQRCRVVIASNPPRGPEGEWLKIWFQPWLDPAFDNPAKPGELRWCVMVGEKIVWVDGPAIVEIEGETYTPRSHTFIPAKLDDNPYLRETGYRRSLENLPEPLRSQLLKGDFSAGQTDAEQQVIPSAWVKAAMARWKPDGGNHAPQVAIGVDVAQGGQDDTTLSPLHANNWFGQLIRRPGKGTPDGPSVAGLIVQHRRGVSQVVLDCTGGWGGSSRDILVQQKVPVIAFVASAKSAERTSPGGDLGFANKRAEAWWKFREGLDPTNKEAIALPPDPRLEQQLISPTWRLRGTDILIESKDEIRKRLGRSTDDADAVIQAWNGRAQGARNIAFNETGGRGWHDSAPEEDPF